MQGKAKKNTENTTSEEGENEVYLEYSIDGGINIENHSTGTINVTIIQSGNPSQPQPPKP
jgi:hypothetical protein